MGELRGQSSLGGGSPALDWLGLSSPAARQAGDFATPMAVAVRGSRVYVADPQHGLGPRVHVLDLQSRKTSVITQAGGAALRWPIDVAVAGENLAIADAQRAAVFVLDSQGRTIATVGAGMLRRPASVAWRSADEPLWVMDAALDSLLIFAPSGALRGTSGGRGAGLGQYNHPAGVSLRPLPTAGPATASPSNSGAVADSMNFRVQMLGSEGDARVAIGSKGDAAGDFSLPRDVAFDSAGRLYVLDSQFENVQVFDADGQLLLAFGEGGAGPGEFSVPSGITIDDHNRIWIADSYNRRVQVFELLSEPTP